MPKTPATIYQCQNCDAQFPKWEGRCSECGQWGTLEKTQSSNLNSQSLDQKLLTVSPGKVVSFDQVKVSGLSRTQTGISEFDRVLGGGLVTGSLILLGGEPGIGKSTLVLQLCEKIKGKTLYVSGEESAEQIKTRIDRLNVKTDEMLFLGETNIETIAATIIEQKPKLAVIDSIQTVYSSESPTGAGSINQVRICTTKLLEAAKRHNITILIIGHVTKFGEVAGPKTLEHLVDAVLYLEGDQLGAFRILRQAKNRFGSTNEVGIFEMQTHGLIQVSDPAAIFLTEKNPVAGTIITATLEGSRVFLLEVQALVSLTHFGYPQRKTSGFDLNRLQLLVAMLSQRLGLKLNNKDIYLNIVGGLKITEPAVDLAVCLAIISALKDIKISSDTLAFGETGLGGEVRAVSQQGKRISEAEKLGFKNIILPQSKEINKTAKIKLLAVKNLAEAAKLID